MSGRSSSLQRTKRANPELIDLNISDCLLSWFQRAMKSLISLILFALLTGCASATSQPGTPAVSTNLPEGTTYTSTFSLPTPTLSDIPKLTETPIPAATITPVWMEKMKHYAAWGGYSLDKSWIWGASDTDQPEPGTTTVFRTTRFVSADGKLVWDVQPNADQTGGRPYEEVSYEPIFWLPLSPYVYLTVHACCTDGSNPGFFTGMNLARLNLRTGEFSMQIAEWDFHEFIFSPNGMYLFEATAFQPEVHLIRLSDWKRVTVDMPSHNRRNGGGAWSPDNQKIVFFSIMDDPKDEWKTGHSSIILIDMSETPEYRVLVSDIEAATGIENLVGCVDLEWVDPNKVHVYMKSGCSSTDQWTIDTGSGQVEKIK
jgi:hypothetical protein